MNDVVLSQSEKTSAILVEFLFGSAPTPIRYTDWTAPINHLGRRYESVPSMAVELPANTAGFGEEPLRLTLPLNAFTLEISSGEPHAPVAVIVREKVLSVTDGVVITHLNGRVKKAFRNVNGNSYRVRLECVNVKDDLDKPLGIIASSQCAQIFGQCGVNLVPLRASAKIVAIADATIQVVGLAPTTSGYWRKGYVSIDGLDITVREYTGGDQLVLVRPPPRAWLDQTAVFTPGCGQDLSACRGWGNESNFLGLGIKMPDYHPIVEAP